MPTSQACKRYSTLSTLHTLWLLFLLLLLRGCLIVQAHEAAWPRHHSLPKPSKGSPTSSEWPCWPLVAFGGWSLSTPSPTTFPLSPPCSSHQLLLLLKYTKYPSCLRAYAHAIPTAWASLPLDTAAPSPPPSLPSRPPPIIYISLHSSPISWYSVCSCVWISSTDCELPEGRVHTSWPTFPGIRGWQCTELWERLWEGLEQKLLFPFAYSTVSQTFSTLEPVSSKHFLNSLLLLLLLRRFSRVRPCATP